MLLNVPDASLLVAQPLGRVVPTQFLDEFFGATGDVPRKVDGVDTLQEKKTHYLLVKTDANHHLALIIGRSEDKVRNFIDTYDDAHPGDSADMTTGQLLE